MLKKNIIKFVIKAILGYSFFFLIFSPRILCQSRENGLNVSVEYNHRLLLNGGARIKYFNFNIAPVIDLRERNFGIYSDLSYTIFRDPKSKFEGILGGFVSTYSFKNISTNLTDAQYEEIGLFSETRFYLKNNLFLSTKLGGGITWLKLIDQKTGESAGIIKLKNYYLGFGMGYFFSLPRSKKENLIEPSPARPENWARLSVSGTFLTDVSFMPGSHFNYIKPSLEWMATRQSMLQTGPDFFNGNSSLRFGTPLPFKFSGWHVGYSFVKTSAHEKVQLLLGASFGAGKGEWKGVNRYPQQLNYVHFSISQAFRVNVYKGIGLSFEGAFNTRKTKPRTPDFNLFYSIGGGLYYRFPMKARQ